VHRHWINLFTVIFHSIRYPTKSRMTTEVILRDIKSVDLGIRRSKIGYGIVRARQDDEADGNLDIPILVYESGDGFVFQENPFRAPILNHRGSLRFVTCSPRREGRSRTRNEVLILKSLTG